MKAAVIKHQKELTILQQGRAWQLTLHDPRLDAMEGGECGRPDRAHARHRGGGAGGAG